MPDTWDFSQPKRDHGRMPPIMTWGLIAICVVLFLAWELGGDKPNNPLYHLGHLGRVREPQTYVWAGDYAILFSYVFLHGGWMHIGFNMLMLYQLGAVLEETINPLAYAGFLMASAIVGSGAELAGTSHVGIGMSGVVYAIAGLMWAGRGKVAAWREPMSREVFYTFLIWGVICIVLTWTRLMPIANFAHFGGLLFGLAVGYLFIMKRRAALWGAVMGGLILVTILSLTWMPWSADWLYTKGDLAAKHADYTKAIIYYRRSLARGEDSLRVWQSIDDAWSASGRAAFERHDEAGIRQAADGQIAADRELQRIGSRGPADRRSP